MEQKQTKQQGCARRWVLGAVVAAGGVYLILILAISILRGAARREGQAVVRWIETTKETSGSLPGRVGISTRFSWRIQVMPGNDYKLVGSYLPFGRLFWIYKSADGQWVDDRDN
jgi:hypothetical protein